MATHQSADPSTGGVKQGFAAFGSIAVGIILLMNGVLQLLEGISAISTDKIMVVGPQYTYQWSTTGWGWVHVILGVIIVLVGLAVMTGAAWARVIAVFVAALSIIANFLWLPYYPWWSVLLIALNMFAIWALATWHPRRA